MKFSLRIRGGLCLALCACIVFDAGQLPAAERLLTLKEALTTARDNNGDLKALRGEQGIVESARITAGLNANPVFELEGATGALTGSPEESSISIGVSQEFLTGGKKGKRLAVADCELAKFAEQVKDLERLSLLEVKLAFHDLRLAQGRVELAAESSRLSDQLLLLTRERLAAGDVAELEVNLAKVEAARGIGRRTEAERDLVSARLRLLSLMGVASGEDLSAGSAPEPGKISLSLPELKALALKHRPDLKVAQWDKAKGEAELQLAQAERLPNVTAGIGISREASLTSLGGVEERETDYLIGLKLTVPIPVFDSNQAGTRVARTRVDNALSRQNVLRQGVELEVAAAHARFNACQKALQGYASEIMPQLSENLQLLEEAYRLGEAGIAALIEEQKNFHEVSESHLVALHQSDSALARLEAALGLDFDEIEGGRR